MRSAAEAKYRKVLQSKGKAKIARQRRSKARIGNGVVTRALLRQARAEMGTDRHGKGNVKLGNKAMQQTEKPHSARKII